MCLIITLWCSMEDLRPLFEKLNHLNKEERLKLWNMILKKNKEHFEKRMKELKKVLNKE